MKTALKSVDFWWSYRQNTLAPFYGSRCSSLNNRCRMAELTASEMSASSSTTDNKKARRRRKMVRCCGLYSLLEPRSDEHPRRQADVVNEQDSSRAATVREARNVCHGFAMYTNIHGMKNAYRAGGQWKSVLVIKITISRIIKFSPIHYFQPAV